MMDQRILIISHSATNSTNNVGKTLAQMFQKAEKDSLAQLFFNTVAPNLNICKCWFNISDTEMLSSIFKIGKKAGGQVQLQTPTEQKAPSAFYERSVGRSPLKLLARDVVWCLGRYDKAGLQRWIKEFSPTAVFLAPGYSCFAYRIAMDVCKTNNIPLVMFTMDDFYNELKNKFNPIEWVRRAWLKHYIKKAIYFASYNFVCSQEMADYYHDLFGRDFHVLYTPYIGSVNTMNGECSVEEYPHDFLYAGGLGLGRGEVLLELGRCLDKYEGMKLHICSDNREKDIIQQFPSIKSIVFEGFVDAERLDVLRGQTDVVLHVESFEKQHFDRARYSVSTKIPECLDSGKKILVIGPKEQSSIGYIDRNKAGIVCGDMKLLPDVVQALVENRYDHCAFFENAKALLEKNHDPGAIFQQIMGALSTK